MPDILSASATWFMRAGSCNATDNLRFIVDHEPNLSSMTSVSAYRHSGLECFNLFHIGQAKRSLPSPLCKCLITCVGLKAKKPSAENFSSLK